jgi:hypothetical protein
MDIGEIVSDSVMYPSSDWKKVLILGILSLLSILIVPIFLVLGYAFRALKSTMDGSEELPEFDEWGNMFIDGLKVFVVELVYALPALIILIIGLGGTISALYFGGNTSFDPWAMIGVMGITLILGLIVGLIMQILSIMAVANMAYNNSELGAAFRFGEILEIISQIGWVDYIIWFVVIVIIGGAIVGVLMNILGFIPYLGTIIGILVIAPYFQLFYYRALGLLYAYE